MTQDVQLFPENPVNEDKILAVILGYGPKCARDPGYSVNEDEILAITLRYDPRCENDPGKSWK